MLGEPVATRPGFAAERGPVVDRVDLGGDGGVQLVQRREHPIGEVVDHPVRDDLHPRLDMPLVARLERAGRDRGGAVVLQKLRIRRVHLPRLLGPGDLVRRGRRVVRDHDLGDAAEVLERAPVRVQPGRLLLVQTPVREHHPGERQRRDEHRHPRRLPRDRVRELHLRPSPIDLHRMGGDVRDREGQVVDADVLRDDLAEPFIPIEPCTGRGVGLQIPCPQHLQRRLVPPQPGCDDPLDVDRDELVDHALAAIGEQPIDVLQRQPVDLLPRREPFLVENPPGPGDRAMRAPRHRLDLPIRIPLQQQAHHKPVVRHRRRSSPPATSPWPRREPSSNPPSERYRVPARVLPDRYIRATRSPVLTAHVVQTPLAYVTLPRAPKRRARGELPIPRHPPPLHPPPARTLAPGPNPRSQSAREMRVRPGREGSAG